MGTSGTVLRFPGQCLPSHGVPRYGVWDHEREAEGTGTGKGNDRDLLAAGA